MTIFKKAGITSFLTAACALVPLNLDVKAEEYKKGFYGFFGFGSGNYSDILRTKTDAGNPSDYPHEYGLSYEGGVGYDFGKRFRMDLSYTKTTSPIETDLHAVFGSIMVNGYLDFPIKNSKWEPFLGVGFGSSNIDAENLCNSDPDDCTDDVFTFGVSGGVNYALNGNIDLTGKVTYLGFDTINITDNNVLRTVPDSNTLAAHAGIKFKF
tara:strand:+ start:3731 stop:4360 length:630 start_codon:yes stop_codon:yes gene_type:complete